MQPAYETLQGNTAVLPAQRNSLICMHQMYYFKPSPAPLSTPPPPPPLPCPNQLFTTSSAFFLRSRRMPPIPQTHDRSNQPQNATPHTSCLYTRALRPPTA